MTAVTILQTEPYPIYVIDLTALPEPASITHIMKSLNILKYVYTFEYKGKVIKHGISVNISSVYGERIYRQSGHLDGWANRLQGPSGQDMEEINRDYFDRNGENLNRMGMTIAVHDLTNIKSPSISDKNMHVKQLERQLIREYEEKHGNLPIGNKKDESYVDSKTYITDKQWNRLFDV